MLFMLAVFQGFLFSAPPTYFFLFFFLQPPLNPSHPLGTPWGLLGQLFPLFPILSLSPLRPLWNPLGFVWNNPPFFTPSTTPQKTKRAREFPRPSACYLSFSSFILCRISSINSRRMIRYCIILNQTNKANPAKRRKASRNTFSMLFHHSFEKGTELDRPAPPCIYPFPLASCRLGFVTFTPSHSFSFPSSRVIPLTQVNPR